MSSSSSVCSSLEVSNRGVARPSDELGVANAAPAATELPVFFINRDGDVGRRAVISYELQRAGLQANRVRGVEGLHLPPELVGQFYQKGRLVSELTPGEVGCYASHLLAMQAVVDRGLGHALILEDDAQFSPGIAKSIAEIVAKAPKGWGVIHLCRDSMHAVKPIAPLCDGRQLVRYSRVPAGMVGYLVSQEGARRLTMPRRRYWPCDTDLRQPWRFGIDVYGVTPQIIAHDNETPSAIRSLGGQSRLRRGLPRPTWYCWTGNPMHSPAAVLYNMRALGLASWLRCSLSNASMRISRALEARERKRKKRALAKAGASSNENRERSAVTSVAAE